VDPDITDNQRPNGEGAQSLLYRYVLGTDGNGNEIYGGAHQIVARTGKAEAIDYANRADALHSALKGSEYTRYDASLTSGETDFDVFPSQWWAQKHNGIARRWNGGSMDYNDLTDEKKLSPSEKYDLVFNPGQEKTVAKVEHWNQSELDKPEEERGEKHSHPEVTVAGPATKWELQNHGIYNSTAHPASWYGHCNGWAAYVTAEEDGAPKRDIWVKRENGEIVECTTDTTGCMLFYKGDIEALMTELYFSDKSGFSGRRCKVKKDKMEFDEYDRPEEIACRDLNPGSFHIALTGLLNRGATHIPSNTPDARPPFVVDYTYSFEVWNYPVSKYKIDSQKSVSKDQAIQLVGASGSDYVFNSQATKFVEVKLSYWMVSDAVPHYQLHTPAHQRGQNLKKSTVNYVLELDDNDKILGGEWIKDPSISWGSNSKKLHPDFMWLSVDHQGWGESSDDKGGYHDNPYISYPVVKALLRCSNDPTTCQGGTPPPPPPPSNICQDRCGQQASGQSCYCDEACKSYGDCCQSDTGAKGPGTAYVCQACSSLSYCGGGSEPTVSNTTSACGSTASGTISLTATGSDLARVVFLVAGNQVGEDTSAPYSVSWDSTTVGNGAVELTARGVSASGQSVEDSCSITVNNGGTGDVVFDMESGTSGWSATGLWHLANSTSCASPGYASATHAWYFGQDSGCTFDTGSTTKGTLTTPQISGITASSTLTFSYFRGVEKTSSGKYDKTTVEVAEDGSSQWTSLFSLDSLTTSDQQWKSSGELSLASFAGRTIRVRFTFDSVDNYANKHVGWLIDDVTVTR
jgi:hypothetical protein